MEVSVSSSLSSAASASSKRTLCSVVVIESWLLVRGKVVSVASLALVVLVASVAVLVALAVPPAMLEFDGGPKI